LTTNIPIQSPTSSQTIIKTDLLGYPVWTRRDLSLEGFEYFSWINPSPNGGYRISANSGEMGSSHYPSIVQTDSFGYYGCPVDTTQIQLMANFISLSTDTISVDTLVINSINRSIIVSDSLLNQTDICFTSKITSNIDIYKVFIYPNPAIGQFTIENNSDGYEIIIYDLLGKIIYSKKHSNSQEVVNLTSNVPGIYVCKIVTSFNEFSIHKIIIQ
jgi:hypothetical protein